MTQIRPAPGAWLSQLAVMTLLVGTWLSGDALAQQLSDADRTTLLQRLGARADHFAKISQQIWEFAEVGYQETKSAALLKEELRAAGFAITENIGNIPTAFSAQAGSGSPVIGILGEYDALPGLFQEAVPMKQPARSTKAGHGCGHNLRARLQILFVCQGTGYACCGLHQNLVSGLD